MNPRAERLLQHSNIYNQANTESVSENDTCMPIYAIHVVLHILCPFIFWLI